MTKNQSILVTGATSQLARSFAQISSDYPEYEFYFVNRGQLDFADEDQLDSFFQQNIFGVIINCAAYTAVDKAEQEPELADKINHIAVKKLAQFACQSGSALIHVSTDYVFDGTLCRPYTEQDATKPQSVYGSSKLKGEQAIRHIAPKGFIIRTGWLYSDFGHNFVKTMLRLGSEGDQLNVVFDQVGTPTYASDLARAIMQIVKNHAGGWTSVEEVPVYHYSNEGVCSWYDFTRAIFDLAGLSCELNAIESRDYPTPAERPHFSVLNKNKIKQDYQLTVPYWKDSLASCIDRLVREASQ